MILMAIEKAQPRQIPNENLRKSRAPIPISDAMRPVAMTLIAKGGKTYEELSDEMNTKYQTPIEPKELERLARTSSAEISKLRKEIRKAVQADAKKMLKKVDTILTKALDRTINDMDKLENLDALFAAGLIDREQYSQGTEKLKIMPIKEVIQVANHISESAPKTNVPQQQVPGNSNSDSPTPDYSEAAQELARAIANGDPVEIQRIQYGGNSKK